MLGRRSASDDEIEISDNETEEERIIREMDRDISPASSDVTLRNRRTSSSPSTSTSPIDEESVHIKDEDKISIKLKYLNDEIKTVECFLNESLGNFKR